MVGEALTTDWRRFIHWRPLARLGDFFEHSKKIAKLDEALTTADDRWRCTGNVLTLSGDVWRCIGDVSKIVGRQCIARRRQLVWKGLKSLDSRLFCIRYLGSMSITFQNIFRSKLRWFEFAENILSSHKITLLVDQIYMHTASIYIRQVLAIYFQVFFLALQCSDKPESSYPAS